MTVERPRWMVVMVGLSAALFAVLAARAPGRDAPVPRVAAQPAGPPTSARAAAEADALPRAPTTGSAGIPTRTMPCVDDTTDLLADPDSFELELLCWGDHCLRYPFHEPMVPRPATSSEPEPVVGPDEVCTGTRCDPLGPKLRAALEREDDGAHAAATQDHAKIVFAGAKIWDRASDRVILEQFDAGRVEILGNRLVAVTDPGRWGGCTAAASLVDARGRARGKSFPILSGGTQGISTLALHEDRFLVFGCYAEITLIDDGHVAVLGQLLTPQSADTLGVRVRAAVRLKSSIDSDRAAILWCTGSACHVTKVYARRDSPRAGSPLELHDEAVLPRCGT